MGWIQQSRRWQTLAMLAAMTLTVFVTAYLGIQMTRDSGRVASIWLANAVVVLAMLGSEPRRWPGWLVCSLIGNMAANLATGDVNGLATILGLSNTLEILVVCGLFRLLVPEPRPDLARVGNLVVFMVVAGGVGPAVSATLAASILHWHQGLAFTPVFQAWFSADSLGLLILVPLLAGLKWQDCRSCLASASASKGEGLLLLVLVPVAASSILHGHVPWVFLLSPLFMWAAFRFGFAGMTGAVFLATASGVATLHYQHHAGQIPDIRASIAFLQLFLFTNVLIFLPMASLMKALRESEAQFRVLFDKAPIGMAIMDSTSGRFLSVNPRLSEILGYPAEELQIRTFAEITHPEHLPADRASLGKLASGTVTELEIEKRYLHRSGQEVRARVRVVRLPAAPGAPARHLSLVEDITAATLAQEQRAQAMDRLQKITDRVPGAVYQYRLSPDGQASIPYASEAMNEIFRVSPGQAPDPAHVNSVHHPEDHAAILASIQASARDLTPWRQDYRLKFPDGTIRHLLGNAVPEREADGSLLWTGFIADITERKQLENKLAQSQKMESLGVLAGGVAHDMNNVLGAILGLASAHLSLEAKDSPAYRAFATIREAATRGGTLVKGLLNFSRQSPGQRQVLDLNEIILEVARLLERTTLAKVRLELDLAPGPARIHGDPGALHHAIMNLCVNAVDAMADSGTLILRSRNLEQGVEVEVADTGTGMTREVLEKAMDPFFTTKAVGKGTGLGLAIVYATVKAHQGHVELHSEPGRGTRIKLAFPAGLGQDPADLPGVPAPPVPPPQFLKVLLVDDDELILSSTRMLLEVLGHTVTPASDGEEALRLLEGGLEPDVAILDMNMPGLGGRGTLPRLRQLRPRLPVILATGRADQDALDLLAEDPCSRLLAKPFSMDELQTYLATLGHEG